MPNYVTVLSIALATLKDTPTATAFWFPRGTREISHSGSEGIVNIVDFGAVPHASDSGTAVANAAAINNALSNLTSGDTLLVPAGSEFYSVGGLVGANLTDVTIQIDGTLRALPDFDNWPMDTDGSEETDSFSDFLSFYDCAHITFQGGAGASSKDREHINGMGKPWWNANILGTMSGKRPKLVHFHDSRNMLLQNVILHSSPSFHLQLSGVAEVEVYNVTVLTDRKEVLEAKAKKAALQRKKQGHDLRSTGFPDEPGLEPQDLNTDGIDPSGRDVWVHDCNILNDDDSIAVKPCHGALIGSHRDCKYSLCSENMLFENMVMTGFGASIGSVPPNPLLNCVRNITFRNISMPRTGKGVYVKSNPLCNETNGNGIIEDILYEDMEILEPSWWPIWIGPQQQHEPNQPLAHKCPLIYPIDPICPTQSCVTFRNIMLRNIYVENPHMSPGVILGNASNPMKNISLINVTFKNPGEFPYHREYQCENAEVFSVDSVPVPNCTTKLI